MQDIKSINSILDHHKKLRHNIFADQNVHNVLAQQTGVVQLVLTGTVEDVLIDPVPGQLGGLGDDGDSVVLVLVSLALHHKNPLVGRRRDTPKNDKSKLINNRDNPLDQSISVVPHLHGLLERLASRLCPLNMFPQVQDAGSLGLDNNRGIGLSSR